MLCGLVRSLLSIRLKSILGILAPLVLLLQLVLLVLVLVVVRVLLLLLNPAKASSLAHRL